MIHVVKANSVKQSLPNPFDDGFTHLENTFEKTLLDECEEGWADSADDGREVSLSSLSLESPSIHDSGYESLFNT